MKRLLVALWMLMLANAQAMAQTSPGWAFDFVPTALQWNQEFASKQDYLGATPCLVTGCVLQGKLNAVASAGANAGFNIAPGTVPSTPVNGDMWVTSSGLYVQVNGITVGPLGTGVVGTLAVGSGGTGQSSFTANAPLIGNGSSALGVGSRSGSTTVFATTSGVLTNGHCVSIDASGNLVDAGGACTTGGGGGTVSSASIGQLAIYTGATTVAGLTSCNNGYVGTDGSGVNLCRTTFNGTLSQTITQLGTVTTGVWNASVVPGQYGGTGVANTGFTITVGGNFVTSGAAITLTATGATNVTLPTTGTLMNQNGTSGGIPYYSSSTTVGTTSALSLNNPIIGGGGGGAPSSGTRSGNTTQFVTTTGSQTNGDCVSIDASGNHIDAGQACSRKLLNTLTASNSTNLQDTTSLTSTYSWYEIVFENIVPANASATFCKLLVQVSGTFQTTNYKGGQYFTNTTGASGISGNIGTEVNCSNSNGSVNSSSVLNGVIRIYTPASGSAMLEGSMFYYTSTGVSEQLYTNGSYTGSASAVTGIEVLMNAGNITSGSIKIYGNP